MREGLVSKDLMASGMYCVKLYSMARTMKTQLYQLNSCSLTEILHRCLARLLMTRYDGRAERTRRTTRAHRLAGSFGVIYGLAGQKNRSR